MAFLDLNLMGSVGGLQPEDGREHQGIQTTQCMRCHFLFRQDQVVYQGGLLLCNVPGPKQIPCVDDPAPFETLQITPYIPDPKPDTELNR